MAYIKVQWKESRIYIYNCPDGTKLLRDVQVPSWFQISLLWLGFLSKIATVLGSQMLRNLRRNYSFEFRKDKSVSDKSWKATWEKLPLSAAHRTLCVDSQSFSKFDRLALSSTLGIAWQRRNFCAHWIFCCMWTFSSQTYLSMLIGCCCNPEQHNQSFANPRDDTRKLHCRIFDAETSPQLKSSEHSSCLSGAPRGPPMR